jgi:RND family efflux transporter MFP subunit
MYKLNNLIKKMRTQISLGVLLIAVSFFIYSCGNNKSETTENNRKLPLVKVKEITPSTFMENFKVVGVVKPYASAKISSEEGGLILSILKNKGDRVSAGQVVVRLKKDTEGATYEQSLAQYELAKINYEKQKQLYEENATTEIQYLTAKWQLEAAERGLEVLRTRLNKGYIRSPINGVVDEKYMNKGEMSAPGMPILNIVDVSKVKISAGVPERYINDVKMRQSVRITVDVLPGAEFEGEVSYISPTLSSSSRTFEIEIVISNKDRMLKPEMNANIQISKSDRNDAIVIEQDLIVDYGEEKYVFVLEGDVARKRALELNGRNGNVVLVTNGLNIGDKIISEGFQALADGEKVQVVQ